MRRRIVAACDSSLSDQSCLLYTSGTRAGGRRREHSKELQVVTTDVSQIVESSRRDQDRIVLVGNFFPIPKSHFSFAFNNKHDHIGVVVCSLTKLSRRGDVYKRQIYVLSTFGQKTEWMRRNPNVCLEVDEITNQSQWMSVIAKGRYEELPEPQFTSERDHARTLLAKRHSWCLNALAERQLKLGDDSIATLFFRIHVDSMTGLCATGESAETGNAAQK